jgi:hypothetical protein
MKRLYVVLLLAGVVACGGGSDPVTPPVNQQPPMNVASGPFTVIATMSIDECARTDDWNGQYDIEIDGKAFTMGPFTGTWDESAHLARGETAHATHTVRSCTISDWTTVYLTFTNKDSFYGSIVFRHRIAGECANLKVCSTTWTIVGKRVATP